MKDIRHIRKTITLIISLIILIIFSSFVLIKKSANKNDIEVIIIGEVMKQGKIILKEEAELISAINICGGVTKDADLSNVNLNTKLKDGEKIIIPNKKEIEEIGNEENTEDKSSDNFEDKKININKADKKELESLPGFGSVTAENIIRYREEKGDFETIEGLMEIKGIGESKFNKVKHLIAIE